MYFPFSNFVQFFFCYAQNWRRLFKVDVAALNTVSYYIEVMYDIANHGICIHLGIDDTNNAVQSQYETEIFLIVSCTINLG